MPTPMSKGVIVKIEYRLLHLVLSSRGDERIVVGVVHWDGFRVRHAWGIHRVPPSMAHIKDDIRACLDALRKKIGVCANGSGVARLDDVFGTRLGDSGLLDWGALRVARTYNAKAHFDELAGEFSCYSF